MSSLLPPITWFEIVSLLPANDMGRLGKDGLGGIRCLLVAGMQKNDKLAWGRRGSEEPIEL